MPKPYPIEFDSAAGRVLAKMKKVGDEPAELAWNLACLANSWLCAYLPESA